MVKRVLLLVAIALVLVGVATLVIGIFSDTLFWVFVSIGSTVLAGVVLYVVYRMGRRQVAVEAAPGTVSSDLADVAAMPAPINVPPLEAVESEPTAEFAPVPASDLGADFPIAEYDELRVAEILPLLSELDGDELQVVRAAEASRKGRAT